MSHILKQDGGKHDVIHTRVYWLLEITCTTLVHGTHTLLQDLLPYHALILSFNVESSYTKKLHSVRIKYTCTYIFWFDIEGEGQKEYVCKCVLNTIRKSHLDAILTGVALSPLELHQLHTQGTSWTPIPEGWLTYAAENVQALTIFQMRVG